jgi:hypothetical protein
MVEAQASKRTIHYSESRCGSSNKHSFSCDELICTKQQQFQQVKSDVFRNEKLQIPDFAKTRPFIYDASYKNSSSTLLLLLRSTEH